MRYVIYARKSTEDEDRQVLSIEAQIFELREFAAKEKLEIVGPTFVETKTAKEPGRIKFAEMLSFLEKGKADGIISWHPDRLARNSVDGGKIKYFVDNLRENVKRGLRQKIRNGVWPGWAPVGYTNNLKTRGIDIDHDKALKVRGMFEMYATGAYTLHSLANWCKENNLRGNLDKEMSIN